MHGADAVEVLRGIHYTRFLPLKTCIDDQSHTTSTDGSGHGTHVAGTIAAIGGNSTGVVGVNPGSRLSLHIVKVFGDSGTWAYSSDLATALNKCRENGSNVVSMSLGGASRSPPSHTTRGGRVETSGGPGYACHITGGRGSSLAIPQQALTPRVHQYWLDIAQPTVTAGNLRYIAVHTEGRRCGKLW